MHIFTKIKYVKIKTRKKQLFYLYIRQRVCTEIPPDSPGYCPDCSPPQHSLYATPWWLLQLSFKSLLICKTQNMKVITKDISKLNDILFLRTKNLLLNKAP